MGYVIVAIVVLLLVALGVTYFVLNATKASGRAAPSDPGAEGHAAGIAAPDESPAGDTTQVSDAGEAEGTEIDDGAEGSRPRVGDPGPEAGAR